MKNNSGSGLSDREREALKQIAADLSNQEIADKLFISLNTVKTHAKNIFYKNHPHESLSGVIFYLLGYPTFTWNLINKNMKGKTIIKIQGHLNGKWKECFEGMEISYEGNNTILTGNLKDEAHMHGVLNTIRIYNLILISINPVDRFRINNFFLKINNHEN